MEVEDDDQWVILHGSCPSESGVLGSGGLIEEMEVDIVQPPPDLLCHGIKSIARAMV